MTDDPTFLDVDDVLALHQAQVERFGGAVAHPFRAKIIVARTTPGKSPASRERDAESADLDPDRADFVVGLVVGVFEGRKRDTAYSKAAVRAIGLGGYENALRAEGVSSKDVRPARRSLGEGGWT